MTYEEACDVLWTAAPSAEEDALYAQWFAVLGAHPQRQHMRLSVLAVHLLTDVMCARAARECPGNRAGIIALLEEYAQAVATVYEAKCLGERYPVHLPPEPVELPV